MRAVLFVLLSLCLLAAAAGASDLEKLQSNALAAAISSSLGLLKAVVTEIDSYSINNSFEAFNESISARLMDDITIEDYGVELESFTNNAFIQEPTFLALLNETRATWPDPMVKIPQYGAPYSWYVIDHFLNATAAKFNNEEINKNLAVVQSNMAVYLDWNEPESMQSMLMEFWDLAEFYADGFFSTYQAFLEEELGDFLAKVKEVLNSEQDPFDFTTTNGPTTTTPKPIKPAVEIVLPPSPTESSSVVIECSRVVMIIAVLIATAVELH